MISVNNFKRYVLMVSLKYELKFCICFNWILVFKTLHY